MNHNQIQMNMALMGMDAMRICIGMDPVNFSREKVQAYFLEMNALPELPPKAGEPSLESVEQRAQKCGARLTGDLPGFPKLYTFTADQLSAFASGGLKVQWCPREDDNPPDDATRKALTELVTKAGEQTAKPKCEYPACECPGDGYVRDCRASPSSAEPDAVAPILLDLDPDAVDADLKAMSASVSEGKQAACVCDSSLLTKGKAPCTGFKRMRYFPKLCMWCNHLRGCHPSTDTKGEHHD